MKITDLAREELIPVLDAQNAAGIRIYFNGFG